MMLRSCIAVCLVFLITELASPQSDREVTSSIPGSFEEVVPDKDGNLLPVRLHPDKFGQPPAGVAVTGQAEQVGSTRYYLNECLRMCPSLCTGFIQLRNRADFDWRIEGKQRELLLKVIDDSIRRREEYLVQADKIEPAQLGLRPEFLVRVFESDREADEKLSKVFDELVSPQEASYYFAKMQFLEIGLLSSKYFAEYRQLNSAVLRKRQVLLHDLYKANLELLSTGKNADTGRIPKIIRSIYSDVSSDEYLELKTLLGQAKLGETIGSFVKGLPAAEATMVTDFIPSVRSAMQSK